MTRTFGLIFLEQLGWGGHGHAAPVLPEPVARMAADRRTDRADRPSVWGGLRHVPAAGIRGVNEGAIGRRS
jgi:hypothetical protein